MQTAWRERDEEAWTLTDVDLSEALKSHLLRPHNPGENPAADGQGRATNSCDESLEIWLEVQADRVVRAGFWARACLHVVACGSAAAALADGREIASLKEIDAAAIDAALGGLPAAERHCAVFAAEVLRRALLDYLDKRRQEPWKRLYR